MINITTFNFCLTNFNSYSRLFLVPKNKLTEIIGAALFTGWMPFLSPNQRHQSTERCTHLYCYRTLLWSVVWIFRGVYPYLPLAINAPRTILGGNFIKSLTNFRIQLEEAAQGKPSAKYRPTRVVVDAALRRIRKSRHGGHKFAHISVNCQRI